MLKFPVLLACGLLMVAGCSGSGGGSDPRPDPTPTPTFDLEQIFEEVDPGQLARATGRAAVVNPRSGSVTQSADGDTINVEIANFGEAAATFTVTNTRSDNSERWSVDSDDAEIIDGDLMFEEATGTGTVYAGLLVETNIGEDEDYLAYGLWADVPATGTPDIGVFVDSNDGARFTPTRLAGLTGDATYDGEAFGIYSDLEAGGEGELSSFTGDVTLTAAFGGPELGAISGTISRLRDIHDNVYTASTITLGMAPITDTGPGGFFTGDTESMVDTDGDTGTPAESFEGKWGGQFFVDNGAEATDYPGNVAGTFGLANTDDTRSFLGLFLACESSTTMCMRPQQ